jgi:tetratricopeptide (TPR) repeat protein
MTDRPSSNRSGQWWTSGLRPYLGLAARGESHLGYEPNEGLGWAGICGVAAIRGISFNTATSQLLASARPSSLSPSKHFRHGLLGALACLSVNALSLASAWQEGAPGTASNPTAPGDARAPDATARPKISLPPGVTTAAQQSLARVFASYSGKVLRKDEVAVSDLELSLLLAQQSVEQDPDNVFCWRALFNATLLSDGTNPEIESLRATAIERILALDPGDEQMKLRRLAEAIERAPTAEERAARYESLLSPKNRSTLGNQIASRLAFKYAFLLQRTGDVPGFERWLGESVTLDPANPEATAIAAGYFRFASEDAAKEAELLMTAMLANPLDTLALRGFASRLFVRGAYRGASRFLDVCVHLAETPLPLEAYDALLVDAALARWAAGRPEEAENLLTRRQRQLNEFMRREVGRSDPAVLSDPKRLAELRYPVRGNEVVVRAAVLRAQGKMDLLKDVTVEAFDSFDQEITNYRAALGELQKATVPDPRQIERVTAEIATTRLFAALFAYWIAEDATKGDAYIKAADADTPLSEAAKARFSAWAQLRSAEPAKALEMFKALSDESPAAKLGLAFSHLAMNDRRSAAETLLEVWRTAPDTLFGIDARDRLARLLGAPIPTDGVAAQLEALADTVPPSFDRMFREGAQPLAVRVVWGTHPTTVLDPIPATVEIANLTQWPLAIDDTGPVRNILCFQSTIGVAGQSETLEIPYLFHPIDRNFVIPPRGTITLPVDFAYTDLGMSLLSFTQPGCSVTLRAIVNWDTNEGGLRASAFGDSTDADLLRVEGMRLSDEWISSVIARAQSPQSIQDLANLVAVAHAAATASVRPELASDARKDLYAKLWAALPDILAGLDVPTQCWLLFVLPDNIPPLEPSLEPIRKSREPLVRLSYLVRRAAASTDVVLEEAIRSDDERIARYGAVVKGMLLHDEEVTRRDFNIGTGRPNTAPEETPLPTPGENPASLPGAKPETPSPASSSRP